MSQGSVVPVKARSGAALPVPLPQALPVACGLGCCLATLLLHTYAVSFFQRYPAAGLFAGASSNSALVAAAALSVLLTLTIICLRLLGRSLPRLRWAAVCVGIFHLCSSALFCLMAAFSWAESMSWTCTFVGALVGLSSTCLLMVWAHFLSRYGLLAAAEIVCLAVLVSVLPGLILPALPLSAVAPAYMACVLVAAGVPVLSAARPAGEAGLTGSKAGAGVAGAVGAACAAGAAATVGPTGAVDRLDRTDLRLVQPEEHMPDTGQAQLQPQLQTRNKAAALRSFADVLAIPAVGLILFAMIMSMRAEGFVLDMPWYMVSQAFIASVLLLCVAIPRLQVLIPIAYRTLIPVLAVAVLAICNAAHPLWDNPAGKVHVVFFLYSAAGVITLVTLVAAAHAGEYPPSLISAGACMLFCVSTLSVHWASRSVGLPGLLAFVMFTTGVYAVGLLFLSLYKGYMSEHRASLGMEASDWGLGSTGSAGWATAVSGTSGRSGGSAIPGTSPGAIQGIASTPAAQAATGSWGSYTAQRCDELAQSFRLTSREREVLGYLALGHSAAYVSEVLLISQNTARTHVRNIYRKLDVSSREQILALVRTDSQLG